MTPYHGVVAVHLLAAIVWLGGAFFIALVGAPVLRGVESPELRRRLFEQLGLRFRRVGWAAIAVLIVSGLVLLEQRGVLGSGVLGSAAFWRTRFGGALAWKLGAVGAMLAASAAHDLWLSGAAMRARPGSPEALRLRRLSLLLARGAAVLGVVIVVLAVRLAR